jgi:hypothetical protein
MSEKINERRRLRFASEDDALAELARLRKGCRPLKNWSMAGICWHLSFPMIRFTSPPASPVATPQEAAMKANFVDVILKTGRPPAGYEAPPELVPPPGCTESEIDRLEGALRKLKGYTHPLVGMGPFGPVPIGEYRQFMLGHCAHHLGYLVPTEQVNT